MGRDFATGIASWQHRALVQAAIDELAAREGIPREEAARRVLDQEHEWRRERLDAQWSPGDAMAEVVAGTAQAAGRMVRRALRAARGATAGGGNPGGR